MTAFKALYVIQLIVFLTFSLPISPQKEGERKKKIEKGVIF